MASPKPRKPRSSFPKPESRPAESFPSPVSGDIVVEPVVILNPTTPVPLPSPSASASAAPLPRPRTPRALAPRVDTVAPTPALTSTTASASNGEPEPPESASARTAGDVLLIVFFLGLTFLYGAFPVKDTDLWWHLKTGQLIRETGQVPRADTYSFAAEGHPWIDLHWGFEIVSSWLHDQGGIVALNLAKCAITCLAAALLIFARKPNWPLWAMLAAWLPALFMLSGRMYIRPETLTLLYMAGFLAILFRWTERPNLAFLLPILQILWVNSQGLFIFGPFLIAVALLDAATARRSFVPARKVWWAKVLTASALTGLACLANPYGLSGALFPFELLSTMNDDIFKEHIQELSSIPKLIRDSALGRVPSDWVGAAGFLIARFPDFPFTLQMQIVTIILGAISFLLLWTQNLLASRGRTPDPASIVEAATDRKRKKGLRPRTAILEPLETLPPCGASLGIQPFRLILFIVFTYLSWQATRNSHQFAAIVGTITAWNFGEWAASAFGDRAWSRSIKPRLATLGLIGLSILALASGWTYAIANEKRTIGLGEEPLWYPHEAVKFAGGPGMPDRFLGFHDGHASLYEYYHAPQKKVHSDARLEVMGAQVFRRYINLKERIRLNKGGWAQELEGMESPVVLTDHVHNFEVGARIMAHPSWRCVWFDPVAAVFLHQDKIAESGVKPINFAARLLDPSAAAEPKNQGERLALASGLRNYANALLRETRLDLARPIAALGAHHVLAAVARDPDSLDSWKLLAQLELFRNEWSAPPIPGQAVVFRQRLDCVADAHALRAVHSVRQSLRLAPRDFLSLYLQSILAQMRGLDTIEFAAQDSLSLLTPINPQQAENISAAIERARALRSKLKDREPKPRSWENRSELEKWINEDIARGDLQAAADLMRSVATPNPWEWSDLLATLHLHLGQPREARDVWQAAAAPGADADADISNSSPPPPQSSPPQSQPQPGLRASRIALTYFIEGDLDAARQKLHEAAAAQPTLFDAHYLLAVVELESGQGQACAAALRQARQSAPDDSSRTAVRVTQEWVEPQVK